MTTFPREAWLSFPQPLFLSDDKPITKSICTLHIIGTQKLQAPWWPSGELDGKRQAAGRKWRGELRLWK